MAPPVRIDDLQEVELSLVQLMVRARENNQRTVGNFLEAMLRLLTFAKNQAVEDYHSQPSREV